MPRAVCLTGQQPNTFLHLCTLSVNKQTFETDRCWAWRGDLSLAQYDSLCRLCDDGKVGDVFTAYNDSLPPPVAGAAPYFVRKSFVYDKARCCGYTMTVNAQRAMSYDVGARYLGKAFE